MSSMLATYTSTQEAKGRQTWLALINEKCNEASDLQEILKGVNECSNCTGGYEGGRDLVEEIKRKAAAADRMELEIARLKAEEGTREPVHRDKDPARSSPTPQDTDIDALIASHARLVTSFARPRATPVSPPRREELNHPPSYYLKLMLKHMHSPLLWAGTRDAIVFDESRERLHLRNKVLRVFGEHLVAAGVGACEARRRGDVVAEAEDGYKALNTTWGTGCTVPLIRLGDPVETAEMLQQKLVRHKYTAAVVIAHKLEWYTYLECASRVAAEGMERTSRIRICNAERDAAAQYLCERKERLFVEHTEVVCREQVEAEEAYCVGVARVVTGWAVGRTVIVARCEIGLAVLRRELGLVSRRHTEEEGRRRQATGHKVYNERMLQACYGRLRALQEDESNERSCAWGEEGAARKDLENDEAKGYCTARYKETNKAIVKEAYEKRLEFLVGVEEQQRRQGVRAERQARSSIKGKYRMASEFLDSFLKSQETTEALLALMYQHNVTTAQAVHRVESVRRGQARHEEGRAWRALVRTFNKAKLAHDIQHLKEMLATVS